jgi:hypothetical protein
VQVNETSFAHNDELTIFKAMAYPVMPTVKSDEPPVMVTALLVPLHRINLITQQMICAIYQTISNALTKKSLFLFGVLPTESI